MSHTRCKPGGLTLVLTLVLGFFNHVYAHSAVERLMRISSTNGSMVGTPGFPRGYVNRTSVPANVVYDDLIIWRILPQINEYLIAHTSQRTPNTSQAYPPLTAAPGDLVALQYQENGHVTQPSNQAGKPTNRGTVYIYGTTEFNSSAMLLDIHYQWNANGTGGDSKGKLLATRNFDDGQCYQVSTSEASVARQAKFPKTVEDPMGVNLWCQNDLSLPDDLEVGKAYTLIWVWDWPTLNGTRATSPRSWPGFGPWSPGEDGIAVISPEIYTTIMDLDIVDPCDEKLGSVKGPGCQANTTVAYSLKETDLNIVSIPEQCENNFLVDVSDVFNASTASSSNSSSAPSSTPSKSASATPSASNPTSGHNHGNGNGKMVTETVVVPLKTVTVVVRPTQAATTSSGSSATTNAASSGSFTAVTTDTPSQAVTSTVTSVPIAPVVTGFLKVRHGEAKKIRREAGHWAFGHA